MRACAALGALAFASVLVLLPLNALSQPSASLPSDFVAEYVLPPNTFVLPADITFAPDGRIFVAEKSGLIWIVENGVRLPTPFLDIQFDVLDHWDRGLLGIALHPDFDSNGYIYLMYTYDRNGAGDFERKDVTGRLTRYTVSAGDPNVADTSTRWVMIGQTYGEGIPACYFSHAPGSLKFGTDGTLLASTGDGASFSERDPGGLYPECFSPGLDTIEDVGAFRSQYLGSLAGKILRLDPLTGQGLPSNPYYTGDPNDTQSKVWAYGLRNPFRFGVRNNGSTDPADGDPGSLYIGDVGWSTWEEINVTRAGGGENFAWPCWEGPNLHSGYNNENPDHSDCSTIGGPSNPSPAVAPTTYWHHSQPGQSFPNGFEGNTAVGGAFYDGTKFPPNYRDVHFYGDYADNWMKVLRTDANDNFVSQEDFGSNMGDIVDIEFDPVSEHLYYVDIDAQTIIRIRNTTGDTNQPPVAVAQATPTVGPLPLNVQFTGSNSSDPDDDQLTYHWDFGNGATSTQADPSYTYTQGGVFVATLTVTDEFLISRSATVDIIAGSEPPVATILVPQNGTQTTVGSRVFLVGQASDDDDPVENLQFRWDARYRHNDHGHPSFFVSTEQETSFLVSEHGLPNEVNYIEVQLRVTDTEGLVDTTVHYVDLMEDAENDVTGQGTPIALITSPTGTGNPDIETIRDGTRPPAGTTDPSMQYDTFTNDPSRTIDWIGYSFNEEHLFSKMIFQEGIAGPTGGFFDSFTVQVRQGGTWNDVNLLNVLPPYPGNNGITYDAYILLFEAMAGDGIRIHGDPGGSLSFISVAELRVFDLPQAEFTADVTSGPSPLLVQFTDTSDVTNPTSWLWNFGDGSTSTDQNPIHEFTVPGARTVNLTVIGDEGTFFEEKTDFIFVGNQGLTGEYYDNQDFTNLALTRVDPTIDFDWGNGSPDASMGSNSFSIRWTGWIEPLHSEQYTFHTQVNNGVRLWIDDQLIIDEWGNPGLNTYTGSINLTAGQHYSLRMDYFEGSGTAEAQLDWSSSSQPRQVVPQSQLLARECGQGIGDVDGNGQLAASDAFCALGIFVNGGTLSGGCDSPISDCELEAADADCDGSVTPSDALAIYEHQLSGAAMTTCLGNGGNKASQTKAPKTIDPPAITQGNIGQWVIVPLDLTNASGDAIRAFGLNVSYPTNILQFDRVDLAGTLTEGWTSVTAAENVAGQLTVGGFHTEALQTSGTLVNLIFQVDAAALDTGTITVSNFVDDLTQTTSTAGSVESVPPPGAPGLLGTYYSDVDFTGTMLRRVDPVIDFGWGSNAPDPAIGENTFSIVWTGAIVPEYSETYTIYTETDDGVRLWVDGQLLIDQWILQSATEWSGNIALTAGQPVDIRMEFYENLGSAVARLRWESPSQPKQIIPSSNLMAETCATGSGDIDGDGTLTAGDADCAFASYLDGALPGGCDGGVFNCALASADADCDGRVTPEDAKSIHDRQLLALPPVACIGSSNPPVAREIGLTQRVIDDGGSPALQVSLAITDPSGIDAAGLQLNYPSSELQFLRLDRSHHFSSWYEMDANEVGAGQLRIGGYDENAFVLSSPVELFHAVFSFTGAPGTVGGLSVSDLVDDLENATFVPVVTGIEDERVPSRVLQLDQNYPNPFNPHTTIRFSVPGRSGATIPVRLAIFSVKGELIRTLVNSALEPGQHDVSWDGTGNSGAPAPSGVYFYTIQAAGEKQTRRMVLLR